VIRDSAAAIRVMALNTLLRGASISATASSEDTMGVPGNRAKILVANQAVSLGI
jgi:hypothetical protein